MDKNVLLVDDTQTVLMSEKTMLWGSGLKLRTATNGLEALAEVAKSHPDLVLLDIMMPQLDGIETCRRIKQDPETSTIPVVMVTTKGHPDMVEKAFAAGCDDFITKPIDKLELLAKLKTYLG